MLCAASFSIRFRLGSTLFVVASGLLLHLAGLAPCVSIFDSPGTPSYLVLYRAKSDEAESPQEKAWIAADIFAR